ncbi:hypothetical protein JXQ70_17950 [bacterium]|nr:hypothetical protein [bacterium]
MGLGTFTCIHTRGISEGSSSQADHWWAVGTGDIKMVTAYNGTTLTTELQDYNFK